CELFHRHILARPRPSKEWSADTHVRTSAKNKKRERGHSCPHECEARTLLSVLASLRENIKGRFTAPGQKAPVRDRAPQTKGDPGFPEVATLILNVSKSHLGLGKLSIVHYQLSINSPLSTLNSHLPRGTLNTCPLYTK